MVGGGSRRDEGSLNINSNNVFAALGSLKKKKKDPSASSSKAKAAAKKEEVEEKEVFWAPTPLAVKSWADVDDEDDDDYYAMNAPPQAVWGDTHDEQGLVKEDAPHLAEESESEEEGLDEVDDDIEEDHDHEPEAPAVQEPVVQKSAEVSSAPKETERQLSKKELKKKGLEELEAVLAELGLSTGGGPEKSEGANGEAEKKESAPGESKNAKKKKKKDKTQKESKEPEDQPVTTDVANGSDDAPGNDKAEDASAVNVKERLKKAASLKKKKSSKEMDAAAKAAATEAAARNARLAAAKKKEKSHYNQQPLRHSLSCIASPSTASYQKSGGPELAAASISSSRIFAGCNRGCPCLMRLSIMAPWVKELHMSHLEIPVTVDHISHVFPSEAIPASSGDSLYLSNLDDIVGARVFTPTVYFYQANSSSLELKPVIRTLRDALSSVLIPYYPFTGRLRAAGNGKLEVFFGPSQGVLMVEARSELALADIGDLTVPNPSWLPLIYRFPDEEPYKVIDMPLLIAQVTLFSCGGFSLGLRICHCLCDGLGAMQFVNAWAETARSGKLITIPKPCWNRELLRPCNPPKVKNPHTEFKRMDDGSSLTQSLWGVKAVQKCFQISREFQGCLKALAQQDGKPVCSTFDALTAHIWRSWVKALNVKPPDYVLRLTFSVNMRQKIHLPEGFYGNALCIACVTSPVHNLINGRLCDTAHSVREARLTISEEYLRSTVDYVETSRPTRLEFGGKLTITQWTRFPIYEGADFGWGRPVYAGPIDITPTPQVCVLLPAGPSMDEEEAGGSMLVCICLPESAADRFRELMYLNVD